MNIKKIKNNQKGFSLIEMMVTMSVFLIVLSGVYVMVVHYGDVAGTEHSRLRMQQEGRYLMSNFASEVKSAGSVLTLTFTGWWKLGEQGGELPYFNGIQALNQVNYPDGIILASGDPEAVTRTSEPYAIADQGYVIPVDSTNVSAYDPAYPFEYRPWTKGDTGIILCSDGYLVFKVESVTETSITMREEPVYFSGLLNTTASIYQGVGYADPAEVNGDLLQYPEHAPIVRLSSFSIYLTKEVAHPVAEISERLVRQFIRVSDCFGQEDALSDGSDSVKSIISENIWDFQVSYVAYENFKTVDYLTLVEDSHHYFAGGDTSNIVDDLLDDLRKRRLKQVDFETISITDDYGGRGAFAERMVPALGDQIAYKMPAGKFGFKIVNFSVEPKNYNIIY